jgi:two-component system, LytTR family, sensor kinase
LKRKEIIIHSICWIVYAGVGITDTYLNYNARSLFLPVILTYAEMAFVMYFFALVLLPLYHRTKEYAILALCTVSFAVIFICMDYLIEGVLEVKYYGGQAFDITVSGFVLQITWFYIQYALYGFGYYYAREAIAKEKALRIASEELIASEKQKNIIEQAWLRAQINPHFLSNTLAYIRRRVESTDKATARDLMALGKLMRHAYETPAEDGRVPLEREAEQIELLLHLYEQRYENEFFVQFTCEGSLAGFRITPNLLLTLVENALKHGVFNDPARPQTIHLKMEQNAFSFTVSNHIHPQKNTEPDSNVGLENIRRRLQIEYPGTHRFAVHSESPVFTVIVEIKL